MQPGGFYLSPQLPPPAVPDQCCIVNSILPWCDAAYTG